MNFSFLKMQSKLKLILSITFSFALIGVSIFSFARLQTIPTSSSMEWNNTTREDIHSSQSGKVEEKRYIRWFEFKVSYDVLDKTSKLDINSHTKNEAVKLNWIELISYLACKYGNDFSKFKQKDLDAIIEKLRSRSKYG